MIDKKQIAAAQAVLFAVAEPVEYNKIASVLGIDDDTMLTILDELKNKNITDCTVFVPQGALSQALGQKKQNLILLGEKGYNLSIKENRDLKKYQILIKE